MVVRVRLFAILRERAGRSEIELELPDGARVADALGRLEDLAGGLPLVMAVNREYADGDAPLHAGDELALIPPVSGGAEEGEPGGAGAAVTGGAAGDGADGDEIGADTVEVGGSVTAAVTGDAGHVRVTREPLALDGLARAVARPAAGAVVVFHGVTREVARLEYEAYVEMAEARMAEIVARAVLRHGLCAAAAEHRVGDVPLGEPSVSVAVSAPHREQAFAGAREIIDAIKASAPIWKKEVEQGTGTWVPGRTPSP
jgi:molybdopterin synthase catalytic subunit